MFFLLKNLFLLGSIWLYFVLSPSYALEFTDCPTYIPKLIKQQHQKHKISGDLNINNSNNNCKSFSRGLRAYKYHKSGRRRGMSLGLSRGLNVRQYHKSGRRKGDSFGLSRGLNVHSFHKTGRRNGMSFGLSRGLNVRNFHKDGRPSGESFGLSRGLNVRDFHKDGKSYGMSFGVSRGRTEYSSGQWIENKQVVSDHQKRNIFLFKNINNDLPVINFLSPLDEWIEETSNQEFQPETRNASKDIPFITLLTPEHIGFTSKKSPVLYCYISSPWDGILEFTINEFTTSNPDPFILARIKGVRKKGIYAFNLSDLNVSLKENIEYEFFIAIVLDEIERSVNIVVSGVIKYLNADQELLLHIKDIPKGKRYKAYAKNGFFYDAIDDLTQGIMLHQNPLLKCHRASLLKQVGLEHVAKFDCNL